jgi:hypothetical protein
MSDKLELLTVDKLAMSEVRTFEKMGGYTIQELYQRGNEEPMPASALMALAYITERRAGRAVSRTEYEALSYTELSSRIEARFTFETLDGDDQDGEEEDPTNAA